MTCIVKVVKESACAWSTSRVSEFTLLVEGDLSSPLANEPLTLETRRTLMWQILEKEIIRKARNVLAKQRRGIATSTKYARRFELRTGSQTAVPPPKRPGHWEYDTHFDPVYCIKHARFIAKRIWDKIQTETYSPKPAIKFEIDKPDGGIREIMSFTIPDSAVANVFHRRLTARNKGLFSAYSFAYRPDKNVFEAIIHLQRMIQPPKTFILKYDYSKYFDTIEHSYLKKLIETQKFVVTKAERSVISAFLSHKFASFPSYQTGIFATRNRGVPQGSSLSLFLSNIAAHELDMQLEQANGSFVRFADDVIAIAHSYTDARHIELEFRAHCERSGVKINFDKSTGISMLEGRPSDDVREFYLDSSDGGRLNKKLSIDFLGHCVGSARIDLTNAAVRRIKRRISKTLYIHLLQYARQGLTINPDRIGPGFVDWDLVTSLNEVRKYIYGGLSEKSLGLFIDKEIKLPFVRGVMAFYPLVTNVDTLAKLDGWLESVVKRALKERQRLIIKQGNIPGYSISSDELISGSWYREELPIESRLPSFVRGWRAARKFYKRYGLSEVQTPSYYSIMSLY